jgi:hypothetical protein
VKWLKPASTLGRNPDGTPGTRTRPRGGWTVFDGDDQ